MARPALPDVGLIALVPDRWEAPWQVRHHVLLRLARSLNVVWVTPPKWWRHYLQAPRGVPRVGPPVQVPDEPGLQDLRPSGWLPEIGTPRPFASWTTQLRLRSARRMLERRGCRKIILYIWRPAFGHFVDLIPHDVSCYHIDDEYNFSPVEQPIDPREAHLISQVDQVFIHSPAMMRKKGHLNPHTAMIPNGVDYEAFSTPRAEPSDLATIPHPRIGYVGQISRSSISRCSGGWPPGMSTGHS